MGNCLVTKLKGFVDNDNLKKLGCFTAEIVSNYATTGVYGQVALKNGGKVEFIYEDGTTQVFDGITTPYFDTGDRIGQKVTIKNYYDLSYLTGNLLGYDIALYTFADWSGVVNIVNTYTYGDIISLYRNINLTEFAVGGRVVGSLNELAEKMISQGRENNTTLGVFVNGTLHNISANGVRVISNIPYYIHFDSSLEKGYKIDNNAE